MTKGKVGKVYHNGQQRQSSNQNILFLQTYDFGQLIIVFPEEK